MVFAAQDVLVASVIYLAANFVFAVCERAWHIRTVLPLRTACRFPAYGGGG